MKKILFLGSKQIGFSALNALNSVIPRHVAGAVILDDIADGRTVLPQFQSYCGQVRLPLAIIHHPNELSKIVQFYEPEYVLVVGWYWILPPDLLKVVPGGFIGVHASLLPKYRGNAPLVWAVLRGETQTGVTLFHFDDGMDTGDVVSQQKFEVKRQDTIANVLVKAEYATVGLIAAYARPILEGTAPRHKQNHEMATYAALRRPEDGRIDWSQPAEAVYNFIRAQTKPYPGAFTHLPDRSVLRVWRVSVFAYPYYGVPGVVGQRYDDGVLVACGEGAIVIHECEVEPGKVTPVSSLLKWAMRLGEH